MENENDKSQFENYSWDENKDSETVETVVEEEKSSIQKEESNSILYRIKESKDGGVDVTMPGLIDKDNNIVGFSKMHYENREEAEQVIEASRESLRVMREKTSLEKTFTGSFYRIDELDDGKYKVTLRG